jgi:hypothetical protein
MGAGRNSEGRTLPHLQAALNQFGRWKGQNAAISTRWVVEKLNEKIATIHRESAAAEVERFLGGAEGPYRPHR